MTFRALWECKPSAFINLIERFLKIGTSLIAEGVLLFLFVCIDLKAGKDVVQGHMKLSGAIKQCLFKFDSFK